MKEYPYDQNRIEQLRTLALDATPDYTEFSYYFYENLLQTHMQTGFEQRYADALYASFAQTTVVIDEGELLVGKPAVPVLTDSQQAQWQLLQQYTFPAGPSSFGQDSHMAVDYELLLRRGIDGMLADIGGLREGLDLTDPAQLQRDIFYAACQRCLEGVLCFSRRYSREAARLAALCTDEKRKSELEQIARLCSRVPAQPAATLYEALQSVHFVTFCLGNRPLRRNPMQYQLGRPDRYLLRYYEADLQSGHITSEDAQTLLDCLGILICHRVPHGLSSGYMVGGRDKNGQVTSNPLTNMLMEVVAQVRLVYPAVGLCWCEDTPEQDLLHACRILAQGHSHPAIFNDAVITKGLMRLGLPSSEACEYIHSTCVEITPIATSNVWVASPYTNLVQVLLDVMQEDHQDMDALLAAYFKALACSIRENYIQQLRFRQERAQYILDPLASCFVRDCLQNGRDIERGGARYNWIMPSFVGLANLADALTVVQCLVFEQNAFTQAQLRRMLQADFSGYEAEHRRILEQVEKYGNDAELPDYYAKKVADWLAVTVTAHQSCKAARLVPSLFCWVMHDEFGRQTGASPDGRCEHSPLGDGSGPAQGREKNGPTAAVLSSTKWDHSPFIGGVAVNMKFSKRLFAAASLEKLAALIKVYLKRGGFELQLNVVDAAVLHSARETPWLYQDLIVRIGGYSDYFTRLSPTMQQEVIQRTEFEL